MKIRTVISTSLLFGFLCYVGMSTLLPGAAIADDGEKVAGPVLLARHVVALEKRLVTLERQFKQFRHMKNQINLLRTELGTLEKINKRLDSQADDLVLFREALRQLQPVPMNPMGIPRVWTGQTPNKINFLFYPMTNPEVIEGVGATFDSNHQAVLMKIINDNIEDKSISMVPSPGTLILIMNKGGRYESLDARAVFLSKRLGPLEDLPTIYNTTKVFPGEKGEMVFLFSAEVNWWKVKELIWQVGDRSIRMQPVDPEKFKKMQDSTP